MSKTLDGFAIDTRDVGFFGLPSSKLVTEAKTSAQAMKQAKLDWKVRIDPVYRRTDDHKYEQIPDRFCIVREDKNTVLGNVGKAYTPLQNVEAFAFVDSLVKSGEARYEVALEVKGGKQVILVAKVRESWNVLGDDPHDLYVILRNGHDGGRAVQELITPVRLRCLNMLPVATKQARYRFSVVHSGKMHDHLAEAALTQQRIHEYVDAYSDLAEALASRKIGEKRAERIMTDVLPDRPRVMQIRDGMRRTLHESPAIEGHRADGWGVFNAITEYMEHGRRSRDREGRLLDTLDGFTRNVRQAAVAAILEA